MKKQHVIPFLLGLLVLLVVGAAGVNSLFRFNEWDSGVTAPGAVWTQDASQRSGSWSNLVASSIGGGTEAKVAFFNGSGYLTTDAEFSYVAGSDALTAGSLAASSGDIVASVGAVTAAGTVTGGSVVTAAGGTYSTSGRGSLKFQAAGTTLFDPAGTGFDRLQFGGTTAAFPAVGRTNGHLRLFGGDGLHGTVATNALYVDGGTFYPSNTIIPSVAQLLGAGGYWVGNSNGNLDTIYTLNGSTTVMKILAP